MNDMSEWNWSKMCVFFLIYQKCVEKSRIGEIMAKEKKMDEYDEMGHKRS